MRHFIFFFLGNNAVCKNKIVLATGGAIQLDGSNFNNKPLDALTVSSWINLHRADRSQSIFSVLNAKNEGRLKLFFFQHSDSFEQC